MAIAGEVVLCFALEAGKDLKPVVAAFGVALVLVEAGMDVNPVAAPDVVVLFGVAIEIVAVLGVDVGAAGATFGAWAGGATFGAWAGGATFGAGAGVATLGAGVGAETRGGAGAGMTIRGGGGGGNTLGDMLTVGARVTAAAPGQASGQVRGDVIAGRTAEPPVRLCRA